MFVCILPGLFSNHSNGKASRKLSKKESGTIQLHPSKRRTQGKKSTFAKCAIL